MNDSQVARALSELARQHSVQASYLDAGRSRRYASTEALLAVLRALGCPLARREDAPNALREGAEGRWRRALEPVHTVWEGMASPLVLRLPEKAAGIASCSLALEGGERRSWDLRLHLLHTHDFAEVNGVRYLAKALPLPGPLPLGYHSLEVQAAGEAFRCLLIVAPARAFRLQGAHAPWGTFAPLYAMQGRRSWGAGDLGDLEEVLAWVRGRGGSLVGTLPLLAAFLDHPFDPSPYAPVSRLFWNEMYLDMAPLLEGQACAEARALAESPACQGEAEALRCMPVVDHRRVTALKRRTLEALSRDVFAGPSAARDALEAWAGDNPEARGYARFRAAVERQGTPWSQWPEPQRSGVLSPADYDEDAYRYHLYAQWAMARQMEAVAGRGGEDGKAGLYLDLPLGVHPEGYDTWRHQDLFVQGVSMGAPPDALGPQGQDWGMPPLHPQAQRRQGYADWLACLRHHMRHANVLRLDHVMGLHRLFWVPRGMPAIQGIYVRYPAQEHYAILALESQRHRTALVGEDLGTVPPYVRLAMARHGLHRMYVAQFELDSDPVRALRPVPPGAAASVNTHDTPTFSGFCQGLDIERRRASGAMAVPQAQQAMEFRQALVGALGRFLGSQGLLREASPGPHGLLKGLLAHLGKSRASLVMVNLEDLWLESDPQNVPGTALQHLNWRRKARYSLEELARLLEATEVLEALAEARRLAPVEMAPAGTDRDVLLPFLRRLTFRLAAPGAGSVALAGDFNGWDPGARPLKRDSRGVWRGALRLAPGRYEYRFVVDGSLWLEDPANPRKAPNPYGAFNSLCEVVEEDA